MVRPNSSLMPVLVSLAICLVTSAHGAEHGRGYVYDGTGAGNNAAIVINVVTRYVGVQTKSDVRIDAMAGFGGNYENCGNEVFFCLTGPLEIVIPKSLPMKRWQYHGLSCSSVDEPVGDAIRVTCRSPNYRGRPTFTYSPSRGVLSIDSAPVVGAREKYELRGQRGLFAAGSNP